MTDLNESEPIVIDCEEGSLLDQEHIRAPLMTLYLIVFFVVAFGKSTVTFVLMKFDFYIKQLQEMHLQSSLSVSTGR